MPFFLFLLIVSLAMAILPRWLTGTIVGGFGVWLSGANFYLTFVENHRRRSRRSAGEQVGNISAVPVVGSLLLWMVAALFRDQWLIMWTALTVSLVDTGGLHWLPVYFAFMVFRSNPERQKQCPSSPSPVKKYPG